MDTREWSASERIHCSGKAEVIMAARKFIPNSTYPKMKAWIEENQQSLRAACNHFGISTRSANIGFKRLGIKPVYAEKKKGNGSYRDKTRENQEPAFCIKTSVKYQSMSLMGGSNGSIQ